MLLAGLKKYPVNLSAIVSMADDGGSTGVLRDELGALPPGDVRQCLVALSESSEIFRSLMNYRFEKGGLKGHSFGNLFLSALEKISGNFEKGVEEASKILNVKGEVIPVTGKDTNLYILLENEKILKGENEINHNYEIEKIGIRKIYLSPKALANKKAIQKIKEADLIIIGPGNHYCSILPNLLVEGIPKAIRESKAKVVYNCNLVNKNGHTEKFDLDDYVNVINGYLGKERIDFVTFNSKKPNSKLIKRYTSHKDVLVSFNKRKGARRKYKIIKADLLSREKVIFSKADKIASVRSFIRHDSEKLAKVLIKILNKKI
jgi:uncharacterized cofD-like protein